MISGENEMNLSQSVLPRAQTTVAPRSPGDRAILLSWLATRVTGTSGFVPRAIVSDTLAANAAESLTGEALDKAWESYVDAVRDEQDAEFGRITWADLWDGLPADFPPGLTAIEIARRNVHAALHLLVEGERGAMSTAAPRKRLHSLDEIRQAGAEDQAAAAPMPRETAERVAVLIAGALRQIESCGAETDSSPA
jgi:hypothetical protein